MENPYSYTQAVLEPVMFFGRQKEVADLVSNFSGERAHSYALFGGRRFGKTSLMRAVERELLAQVAAPTTPKVIPLFLDLHRERITTHWSLYRTVLTNLRQRIKRLLPAVALDDDFLDRYCGPTPPGDDLVGAFEAAFVRICRDVLPREGGMRLVLFIDEAEAILQQPWSEEMHQNLRYLLSNSLEVRTRLQIKMAGSSDFYDQITRAGSPLRNVLRTLHLQPLSPEATEALVRQPTARVLPEPLSDEVVEQIWQQTAGHPYLVQYLMAHLWEEGLERASGELVRELARDFEEEHQFEDWCDDLKPAGCAIYALLLQQGQPLSRKDIYDALPQHDRSALRKALEALSYHGLIACEGHRYQPIGAMFRTWFEENVGAEPPLPEAVEGKTPHIQKLLEIHRSSLRELEIRLAKYTELEAPISLRNQIKDEREEIVRLEQELTRLRQGA